MTLPRFSLLAALVVSTSALLSPVAHASLYSLSESISTTVGSISDSVRGSSRAINVAEGDYKVIDVAQAEDKLGQTRLTLQAAGDVQQTPFYLFVPAAAGPNVVARGDIVTASKRPYGLAFAQAEATTPFVLVLDQAWLKELQPNIVS